VELRLPLIRRTRGRVSATSIRAPRLDSGNCGTPVGGGPVEVCVVHVYWVVVVVAVAVAMSVTTEVTVVVDVVVTVAVAVSVTVVESAIVAGWMTRAGPSVDVESVEVVLLQGPVVTVAVEV
jgi:hypothetical protein